MFLVQIIQGRGRRNQPQGVLPDFPWYSFPNVVAPEIMVQWNEKLAYFKERKVYIPVKINWHWMEEVCLSEALEPYLTKSFGGVQGRVVCMDWRRLFRIQEPVYKELCVEFLAIMYFRKKKGVHEKKTSLFVWEEKEEN